MLFRSVWVFSSQFFGPDDVGIKVYGGYVPKAINVNVTSGFSVSGAPNTFGGELYQLADDVSMTRGTHQFGFGGRAAQARTIGKNDDRASPSFTITGSVTGAGLADFLTGRTGDFNQGIPAHSSERTNHVSLYGQDTWQLKPRLTMSYGLRWAPVLPIQDYHRPVAMVWTFDIDRYRQGLRSSVFVNAPPEIGRAHV